MKNQLLYLLLVIIPFTLGAQTNNHSLIFDETNYASLGADLAVTSPQAPCTVSSWFKNLNENQDPNGWGLVPFFGSRLIDAGFALHYRVGQGVGEYAISFMNASGEVLLPFSLSDNSIWHHVAFTLDGTNAILYVDGNYISTTPYGNMGICLPAAQLYLGAESLMNGNPEGLSNCMIDDFTIWNRVLTQSEIQGYMTCPPTGNEPNLIGYWNLEEGSGTTISDLTPNQYNGIATAPIWSNDAPPYSCCPSSLIDAPPANQYTMAGGSTSFYVVASISNPQYQWQVDVGYGFIDLINGWIYSGATSDLLTVRNVQASQDGELYRCIISNGTCSDTTDAAVLGIMTTSSITNIDNDINVGLYPNPAKDILTIEYAKAENTVLSGVIYNNLGQAVEQVQLVGKEGQLQINITELSAGMYWLKVEDQSLSFVKE